MKYLQTFLKRITIHLIFLHLQPSIFQPISIMLIIKLIALILTSEIKIRLEFDKKKFTKLEISFLLIVKFQSLV